MLPGTYKLTIGGGPPGQLTAHWRSLAFRSPSPFPSGATGPFRCIGWGSFFFVMTVCVCSATVLLLLGKNAVSHGTAELLTTDLAFF